MAESVGKLLNERIAMIFNTGVNYSTFFSYCATDGEIADELIDYYNDE